MSRISGQATDCGLKGGRRVARSAVEHAVARHAEQGRVSRPHPGQIRLTDPEGFLLENDIVSDVFAAVSKIPADQLLAD